MNNEIDDEAAREGGFFLFDCWWVGYVLFLLFFILVRSLEKKIVRGYVKIWSFFILVRKLKRKLSV